MTAVKLNRIHPSFTLQLSAVAAAAMLAAGAAHAQTAAAAKAATLPQVTVQDQAVRASQTQSWRSLERSTSTDLKDVLADEAGVQMGGGNGAAQWFSIRGMGQDQIDVVVDGASSDAQIFHHQGRFQIDPALIKIINIEKGTGSASSGIGATAGRIQGTTVDALDLLREGQNIGFRANVGAHSNRGNNLGLSVYGRSGMFDGLVSVNRVDEKNYKDGDGKTIAHSALESESVLAKVGLSVTPDLRLVLSHRQETEEGVRNIREEFFSDTADVSYAKRKVSTTAFTATGKNHGFMDTVEFDISHMKNEQDRSAAATGPLRNPSNVEITSLNSNLRMSSRVGGSHRIKYGINYRSQEATSSGVRAAGARPQEKTDTGVYVEGIWHFAPITLTTGLRWDRFEVSSNSGHKHSDNNLNPSVGLIWDVNNQLSLNLSHNRATRSPRFYEALLASGDLRYAADLKADRASNTEFGLDFNNDNWGVKASYFIQKVDGVQQFATFRANGRPCTGRSNCPGNGGWRLVRNGGDLKNRGYDLSASYRTGELTTRVGVVYSTPKLSGANYDSVAVATPQGRQWTASLNYKIPQANLTLGWRGRFAEGRSYMNGANRVSRNGFGVSDLYATWQPTGKDDVIVNLAINNVGDKRYRSHSQRTSAASILESGRDIRLGVSYRY